jgi:aminopeptidase N
MGERFGFLAKIDDSDPASVDNAFRIAAHETAHQWWGQQLIPSGATGAKLLLESLPEYTSYQVFARAYEPEKLGLALRQNLNTYLKDRDKADVPLVEAMDSHLVYQKGALAMYAMQDYLGEEVVNGVLAKLLQENSKVPPYPVSQDLVDGLRQATPEKYQYLLTDLFETVTLYDNKAEAAAWTQRADGQYEVALTLNAGKVRADSTGNETPADMNDELDVGVFNAAGQLIYLQKHPFTSGETRLTITVAEPPVRRASTAQQAD